jgi:hypothetical protein
MRKLQSAVGTVPKYNATPISLPFGFNPPSPSVAISHKEERTATVLRIGAGVRQREGWVRERATKSDNTTASNFCAALSSRRMKAADETAADRHHASPTFGILSSWLRSTESTSTTNAFIHALMCTVRPKQALPNTGTRTTFMYNTRADLAADVNCRPMACMLNPTNMHIPSSAPHSQSSRERPERAHRAPTEEMPARPRQTATR